LPLQSGGIEGILSSQLSLVPSVSAGPEIPYKDLPNMRQLYRQVDFILYD